MAGKQEISRQEELLNHLARLKTFLNVEFPKLKKQLERQMANLEKCEREVRALVWEIRTLKEKLRNQKTFGENVAESVSRATNS